MASRVSVRSHTDERSSQTRHTGRRSSSSTRRDHSTAAFGCQPSVRRAADMQRIVSSSRRAHSHAVHAFPSRTVAESIDLELVKLQGQLPKITAERIAMQEEVALAREAERRTREEMRRAQEK